VKAGLALIGIMALLFKKLTFKFSPFKLPKFTISIGFHLQFTFNSFENQRQFFKSETALLILLPAGQALYFIPCLLLSGLINSGRL